MSDVTEIETPDVPENWRDWSLEWRLGYLAKYAGQTRQDNPIKGQARYRWPGKSQWKAWDAGFTTMEARLRKDAQQRARDAYAELTPGEREKFARWLDAFNRKEKERHDRSLKYPLRLSLRADS